MNPEDPARPELCALRDVLHHLLLRAGYTDLRSLVEPHQIASALDAALTAQQQQISTLSDRLTETLRLVEGLAHERALLSARIDHAHATIGALVARIEQAERGS